MLAIVIYMIIAAFIHALWEVQIEGCKGWAKCLPTFKINVFFRKLLGGKPLTGYHLLMLILFQMIFHIPALFINWSFALETVTQGLFIWYFIIEDVAWFIVNPHFTLKRFKKHQIEWHKRWICGLPLSYWVSGTIGAILLLCGFFLL